MSIGCYWGITLADKSFLMEKKGFECAKYPGINAASERHFTASYVL